MSNSNAPFRLTFDNEFLTATDELGRIVKFTRVERAVLRTLASRPGRIFTRQRLLDAMSGIETASDRSVDFVISRLRRKLGDSAVEPVYIGTQYGEGYWWVHRDDAPKAETAKAFLVVGPIRRHKHIQADVPRARAFADELRRQLARLIASNLSVVVDVDCPAASSFSDARPSFCVVLDLVEQGASDCAITARHFTSGAVVLARRQRLDIERESIQALASDIVDAIWRHTAYGKSLQPAPETEPLPISMHNAAALLADSHSWREVVRRLRLALSRRPQAPEAGLLVAISMHTKLIMDGPPQFLADPSPPVAACDEMEALLLTAIPDIQDDPLRLLAAAKLLYFLDRGYEPLALDMAREVLATSAAITSAYAVLGQILNFEGELECGIDFINRAIAMDGNSSEFATYLAALKLQGTMATGEPERVHEAVAELFKVKPESKPQFELHYSGYLFPDLPPDLEKRIADMSTERQTAFIRYAHFCGGRLFKSERHRTNYFRGALEALCHAHGTHMVPDDVKACLPALFGPTGTFTTRSAGAQASNIPATFSP